MKTTEVFKQTIKAYLDKRASEDNLFSQSYAKPEKNIDDCITCILNTVKKSGNNGFTDAEIYSMAVHYYDEDNLDIGKPIKCHVVVNHQVELTEEDKKEAKQKAIEKLIEEEAQAMKKKSVKKHEQADVEQPSLFD